MYVHVLWPATPSMYFTCILMLGSPCTSTVTVSGGSSSSSEMCMTDHEPSSLERTPSLSFCDEVSSHDDDTSSSKSSSNESLNESLPLLDHDEFVDSETPQAAEFEVSSVPEPISVYDIGDIILGKVKLDSLSRHDIFCYLKQHIVPKQNEVITQVVVKGKDRRKKTLRFQLSWLETYKWLVYSQSANGGLCKFCVLFPPAASGATSSINTFVTRAFVNLQKASGNSGKLQSHGKLKYHREAATRAQAFLTTMQNPERSIQHYVSLQAREQYDKNMHVLSTIVNAILYCGKQNIALRGHRDDWTSSAPNKGNFIALLNLIAQYDEKLKQHLEYGKRNALYTSKTVQNEILVIIGKFIREKLTEDISHDSTYFSIIGDEVTESHSNREVLSVCLRFVAWNRSKPCIKEVFFDVSFLSRTTGAAIATAIEKSLKLNNIDISKARGQAYDGAAAMSSENVGAQVRIRNLAPKAVYTHCRSHVLNLSIAATCRLPEVQNMVDGINSVFLFFDLSPKRQKFLELVLKGKVTSTRKQHLIGLCKTRWAERHSCFETLAEIYEGICITLEAICLSHLHPDLMLVNPDDPSSEEWNWQRDRDAKTRAQGLLATMQSSEFIMAFVIVKNCLHILRGMTMKLQKRDIDTIVAYSMIEETQKKLVALRRNIVQEHEEWFKEAQEMIGKVGGEISMPRITGRQQHRSNAMSSTAIEYYRANFSIKFVDHLLSEFRHRFTTSDSQVGIKLLHLLPAHIQVEPSMQIETICSEFAFWNDDLPSPSTLKNELKDWFKKWKDSTTQAEAVPDNLLAALEQCDADIYPCIHRLLVIGCTLPVTSCEAERSFSSLRLTMNHLRSSMGDERLSALMLIHMHQNIEICPKSIIQQYIKEHSRRLFEKSILFE